MAKCIKVIYVGFLSKNRLLLILPYIYLWINQGDIFFLKTHFFASRALVASKKLVGSFSTRKV